MKRGEIQGDGRFAPSEQVISGQPGQQGAIPSDLGPSVSEDLAPSRPKIATGRERSVPVDPVVQRPGERTEPSPVRYLPHQTEGVGAPDHTASENKESFSDRLVGTIRQELISEDAVLMGYEPAPGLETRIKLAGLSTSDGNTHFVVTASMDIIDGEISTDLERARVVWLDEPTMTAGELRWMDYPFSGSQIVTNSVDFTNGDGYPGGEYAGEEYISMWKESGGVIYSEGGERMEDEAKEDILAKLREAQHNQTLTETIVIGYEEDFGAEVITEELPQYLKRTRELAEANAVFDSIIATDERNFTELSGGVTGVMTEEVVNAVRTYEGLLFMEHDVTKNEFDDAHVFKKNTPQGLMQLTFRRHGVTLELLGEERKIAAKLSITDAAMSAMLAEGYDGDSIWKSPEAAALLTKKVQTMDEYKKSFRAMRWVLANLKLWTEHDDDGASRVILPEDLDEMTSQNSPKQLQ